jgi:hypothetical protein
MEDLMKRSAIKALLVATGTAACGAGLLCGSAAQAQVVARVANSSVLAATDWNNHSLDFYYQPIGSPAWSKPQQVAGPVSGSPAGPYGAPSVTQVGDATVIAAGSTNTVYTYTEPIGKTVWTPEPVYDSANGVADPSIAQVGSAAVIGVALSGGNGLFYWEALGKTPWHAQSVN